MLFQRGATSQNMTTAQRAAAEQSVNRRRRARNTKDNLILDPYGYSAVLGVIGSGGALPTGMSFVGGNPPTTLSVLQKLENGYDLKLDYVPAAGTSVFGLCAQAAAAPGNVFEFDFEMLSLAFSGQALPSWTITIRWLDGASAFLANSDLVPLRATTRRTVQAVAPALTAFAIPTVRFDTVATQNYSHTFGFRGQQTFRRIV